MDPDVKSQGLRDLINPKIMGLLAANLSLLGEYLFLFLL